MPNDNNNDDDLTNLSINEINNLYSDIIEFPADDYDDERISSAVAPTPNCGQNKGCTGNSK